jgi:hypothetical protein
MHYSITEEPFYMAQKLPVVSQIAKPIEAAHRNILDNLYRSLRSSGRLMHKIAADITQKQDSAPTRMVLSEEVNNINTKHLKFVDRN